METKLSRNPYPSDVTDEEWAFVAPYLTLMRPDAPQRVHDPREVYNALRWIVRAGAPWRSLPGNFPPWAAVYQQTQRWIAAGCFDAMGHDLRVLLRWRQSRPDQPTATILDRRTLQSTPESGHRAGYDGAKRTQGSKVHAAVDTLGELLTLHVTPANAQDRAQVGVLAAAVQEATGEHVEVAFVDQGDTGETPAAEAAAHGIALEVVKLPEAKRGFVLLPRRWVVERSFAWATRFRRLAKDYERLPETVAGLHFVAFACLMLHACSQLRISALLQPLSPATASGHIRSRLRSSSGIACGLSCRWPAVRSATIGLPARSVIAWSLLPQPPRLRPSWESAPPFWPRRMLVGPNAAAVDHRQEPFRGIVIRRLGLHRGQQPTPWPGVPPALEPAIHRLPGAVPLRQISPRGAGPQHLEDAVEDGTVVLGRAGRPVRGRCGGSSGASRAHWASVSS